MPYHTVIRPGKKRAIKIFGAIKDVFGGAAPRTAAW
jgi:hypothetical protein